MNEILKFQIRENGCCRVVDLSVLEVADIVVSVGLNPRAVRISDDGWLFVSEHTLAGGQSVTLR